MSELQQGDQRSVIKVESRPETQLTMFVGAIPTTVDSTSYNQTAAFITAYQQNLQFVAQTLNNLKIVTCTAEGSLASRFKPVEGVHAVALDLQTSDKFVYAFPRNVIAPTNTTVLLKPQASALLHATLDQTGAARSAVIEDEELGDGGIYKGAETGNLVFVALKNTPGSEQKAEYLRNFIFPDKTVTVIPTPKEAGIADEQRVTEHCDQFIAHPLPLREGMGYRVAIDEKYYDYLSNHDLLPHYLPRGEVVHYVKLDYRDTYSSYILNTLASPTGDIFIEPALQEALIEQKAWDDIDTSRVHVLPSNTPTDRRIRAGLGCKVVIAAF